MGHIVNFSFSSSRKLKEIGEINLKIYYILTQYIQNTILIAFLVVQTVKNLPAVRETWVRSLGCKDPMEECMATHSSILAWTIPMDRGACWATVHGVTKSWTRPSDFHFQIKILLRYFIFSFAY